MITKSFPFTRPFGLVIHGGAGAISRENMTREEEGAYRTKLKEALDAGYAILQCQGPALEAVTAVVAILEDSPLFNAGHGSVLNSDGRCEMDASIMDGRTLSAGAVAGIHHIKNPILLARAVMKKSSHVMLIGEGAENFALRVGFALVPNSYFQTIRRQVELDEAKKRDLVPKPQQDHTQAEEARSRETLPRESKWGTVGCVALDNEGHLAAGTSTGGITNKQYGRVGDSPIIGAGTYADDATCAVSCTGAGEYFIRAVAAHAVASQMEFDGKTLSNSADAVLANVGKRGGSGGLIAIDREANVSMPFNTAGMHRGYRLSTGACGVELFASNDGPR